jgi:hypoxanthine phosphoribosyltransferase
MEKHPLIKEILYTNEQIVEATKKVAQEVDAYYKTQDVKEDTILILGLLKGSVPFLAEFIKHLTCEVETDYMVVSSYHGTLKSSGEAKIVLDVNTPLKDRHVLIVEDVIDSGITLDYIKSYLGNRGVRDIKILTMIDKTYRRQKTVKVD